MGSGVTPCDVCYLPLHPNIWGKPTLAIISLGSFCPHCYPVICCKNCGLNWSQVVSFLSKVGPCDIQAKEETSEVQEIEEEAADGEIFRTTDGRPFDPWTLFEKRKTGETVTIPKMDDIRYDDETHRSVFFGIPRSALTKQEAGGVFVVQDPDGEGRFEEEFASSEQFFTPFWLMGGEGGEEEEFGEEERKQHREYVVRSMLEYALKGRNGVVPDMEKDFDSFFSRVKLETISVDDGGESVSVLVGSFWSSSGFDTICKWCVGKCARRSICRIQKCLRDRQTEGEGVIVDSTSQCFIDVIGVDAFGEVMSFLVFPCVLRLALVCRTWACFFRTTRFGWVESLVISRKKGVGLFPSVCWPNGANEKTLPIPDRWHPEELYSPRRFYSHYARLVFGDDRANFIKPTLSGDRRSTRFDDQKVWMWIIDLLRACPGLRNGFSTLRSLIFANHRPSFVTDNGEIALLSLLSNPELLCEAEISPSHQPCANGVSPYMAQLVGGNGAFPLKRLYWTDFLPTRTRIPENWVSSVRHLSVAGGTVSSSNLPEVGSDLWTFRSWFLHLQTLDFHGVYDETLVSLFRNHGSLFRHVTKLRISHSSRVSVDTRGKLVDFPDLRSLRRLELSGSLLSLIFELKDFLRHVAETSSQLQACFISRSGAIETADAFDVRPIMEWSENLRGFALTSTSHADLLEANFAGLDLSRLCGLSLSGCGLLPRCFESILTGSSLRYLVLDGCVSLTTKDVLSLFDKLRNLRSLSILGVGIDWRDILHRGSSPSSLRRLAFCHRGEIDATFVDDFTSALSDLLIEVVFQNSVADRHMLQFIDKMSQLQRLTLSSRTRPDPDDGMSLIVSRCDSRGIYLCSNFLLDEVDRLRDHLF